MITRTVAELSKQHKKHLRHAKEYRNEADRLRKGHDWMDQLGTIQRLIELANIEIEEANAVSELICEQY